MNGASVGLGGSSTPQTPGDVAFSRGIAMPKFDIPDNRTARAEEVESASLRRWLPLLALAALLLFAAVCGALAWRQYQDAQRTDLKDARAKAVVAATIFDSIFRGEIGTLDSISQAPVVVNRDTTGMRAVLPARDEEERAALHGRSGVDRRAGQGARQLHRDEPRACHRRLRSRLLQGGGQDREGLRQRRADLASHPPARARDRRADAGTPPERRRVSWPAPCS